MTKRHIWTAECDGMYFTNILYTFFKTMYILKLGEVSNLYCYYIVCVCVCVSGVPAQVTQTHIIVPNIHAKQNV